MTTYDYSGKRLQGWQERTTFRISTLADHYPIPFLRGTDGDTYRQRIRGAKEYAARIRMSDDDVIRVRKMLADRPDLHKPAKAA